MKSSFQANGNPRSLIRYAIAVTTFTAVGIAISWIVRDALLLIFAGLLFAAFLDAITGLLGKALAWPRSVLLAIVCTVIAAVLFAGIVWGGAVVAAQGRELAETLQNQVNQLIAWLSEHGIKFSSDSQTEQGTLDNGQSAVPTIRTVLPKIDSLFGQAWTAVGAVLGVLGDALIIVFLGLFVAINPAIYRNTILLLIPPKQRDSYGEVLDECGTTLQDWLLGQSLTMVLIGLFVWLGLMLAGVEPAFILGLQAGLLAFVPTLGPLLAGVVILIASLASGFWGVVGALCVYLLVQALESYVLTPVIQKRAISVPPAFLFASQVILGILFGLYGLALATPLAAIIRVFVLRLYSEKTTEQ